MVAGAGGQDERQSTRVICGGGLDSTENHLNLSANKPGSATKLVNYEVGLTGGYRRISGYQPYDDAFPEVGVGVAEGRVLGIMIFENVTSGLIEIISARKDLGANRYHFYKYNNVTGWVSIVDGLTHLYTAGTQTVTKVRWDIGNDGANNILAVVDGVNNATIYDGTNWEYIDSADTGADFAHAGGDQAINAPSFVSFFANTLHLAGDFKNMNGGISAYSAPSKFYDWTAASGGGQMTTGLSIVQIKPFRSNLYIFGKHGIKKAVSDVTAGFLISDVTSNIGCLATDSVLEIGGDLIFLAPDGIRPVSGTDKIGDVELESISKSAQFMITQKAATNDLLDLNGVVIRSKSQFRFFIGSDLYAVGDAPGIIGGLRDTSVSVTSLGYVGTGWEFGELLGIRASCAASRYIGSTELVLHGDYDGNVYQQEIGNSFNGDRVFSQYSTPYLDLGDTELRKVIEKATFFLRGEGSVLFSLKIDYDWNLPTAINPSQYTVNVDAAPATYGEFGIEYGGGAVYGGTLSTKTINDIQGSFFSIRLTLITNDTSYPASVHSMVLEYSVKGRR